MQGWNATGACLRPLARWLPSALLMVMLLLCGLHVQAMTVDSALTVLAGKDFQEKEQAIEALASSDALYVPRLFSALQAGDLYFRKQDNRLVIKQAEQFYDLQDQQPVVGANRDFKRVGLNNALREKIAAAANGLALGDPDPSVRLAALKAMLGKLSEAEGRALQDRLTKETDPRVQKAYRSVMAFSELQDADVQVRRSAVQTLSELANPEVLARLRSLATNEPDPQLRQLADQVVHQMTRQQEINSGLETLYFGLSLGSVLVLAGIGLAITFGVMGVINMAHGELMMLGAYTTFVLQKILPGQPGLALLLSIPAAFLVSGAVGVVIERSVIRFLYGRPLETLLATFGISLLLQQAVRSIFSPLNQTVVVPSWMSGSLVINDFLSLTLNRLVIILFSLLVFAGLIWLLKRSRLGLEVRSVSQNRAMARNMGVRSERVNALTFGLGSGIAGVAGVALSQLTNVGPNLGQGYIIDAFMVVVFGGVGNLWGTLVAGLTLGVANKLLEPVAGAMLAKILILVAIILFIQKRPRGLFPQRGRAVEG